MESGSHPWFRPESIVGATLQRYPLEAYLGAGGYGAVFRTHSPKGEQRAIKVLYPAWTGNPEDLRVWNTRVTHFMREALATKEFNHRHIVKIFDLGQVEWRFARAPARTDSQGPDQEPGGTYTLIYYVAEYLPDGVENRLKDGRVLPWREAVSVAMQVCEALAVLHASNTIHRDLNPGNIRFGEDGRVVLTDFGVARLDDVTSAYVTVEGPGIHRGVGAPEQYAGEEPDARTDIFQVGALLCVMLTGRYPRAPKVADARSLLTQKGDIPPALVDVVLRCLETDRDKRFQDAEGLSAALQATLAAATAPKERPSKSTAVALNRSWELVLESACWRTGAAPVAPGDVLCAWDNRTLHGLDVTRGFRVWAWNAPDLIHHSFSSMAVQAAEGRFYARHGANLSCLDAQGVERWRRTDVGGASGAFCPAGGLLLVGITERSARPGLAALDGRTGQTLWAQDGEGYYTDHLAMTGGSAIAVEGRGVAGSGGWRVRAVSATTGEVLGTHVLGIGTGGGAPLAPVLARPGPAVPTPDGGVLVWLRDVAGVRCTLYCFDSEMRLRWEQAMVLGGAQAKGEVAVVSAQGVVLASAVLRDRHGDIEEAWLTAFDVQSGEHLWQRRCPDTALFSAPAAGPDGAAVYGMAQVKPEGGKPRRWMLMALEPQSGATLWTGDVRERPRGAPVLRPVVTASHVYVQVARESLKDTAKPEGGRAKGVIEAFARW